MKFLWQGTPVETLINLIYEAAVFPERWKDVLQVWTEKLDATGAILVPGPDAYLKPVCSEALEEVVDFGVREGWYLNNPRVTRGLRAIKTRSDILTERMIFSETELARHPYNAEFINRFRLQSFAGMVAGGHGPAGLFLSTERSAAQGAFQGKELELLRSLVPHVQRAGEFALRQAQAQLSGVSSAVDALMCGAIIIGHDNRVRYINAAAEAMISGVIAVRDGEFGDVRVPIRDRLHQRLNAAFAIAGEHQDPVVVRRDDGRPLIIHILPIVRDARDVFSNAKAILTIVDPYQRREISPLLIRDIFGVTRVEAEIAIALTNGESVDEIAKRRGVSRLTVRVHIKNIFAKTGARRQSELTTIVLRAAQRF